jgi:hypothetical protein
MPIHHQSLLVAQRSRFDIAPSGQKLTTPEALLMLGIFVLITLVLGFVVSKTYKRRRKYPPRD